MSTEELMKPRYKVIALWPNTEFKVGQIIKNSHENKSATDFYNKYPHLFKRLEWWEERRPEDMPEYVELITMPLIERYGQHVKVFNWYKYPDACIFHSNIHAGHMQPITKEEYNTYQQSKQSV